MMKTRTFLAAALAALTLASCSKEGNNDGPTPIKGNKAYMSLAIEMPATPGTYADDPIKENGSEAETKVSKVLVIGFNDDLNIVDKIELASDEQGEIVEVGEAGSEAGKAFAVSPKLTKLLVIINPSEATEDRINSTTTTTYATLNAVITEAVGKLTVADNFMMVSAGTSNAANKGDISTDKGLVDVGASQKYESKEKAEQAANPVEVTVDRVVAKVSLITPAPGAAALSSDAGKATITGWILNATNKTYYPYSELVNYYPAQGSTVKGRYRKDYNWASVGNTAANILAAYNWWHNPGSSVETGTHNLLDAGWNPVANSEYALENTMEATAQDYNNTTKIIIKATFTPTGVTAGASWFRVKGFAKTLAELDADYSALKSGAMIEADYKIGLEKFLDKVLPAAVRATKGWTAEGKTKVEIADLDAVEAGGYKAACVEKQYDFVEYFQNSVCFYESPLRHDNRIPVMELGRWGMVRNNWYNFEITKITGPGLPYIPDPTDPDINDPKNPDPKNPDPDDKVYEYLTAKITINPWTFWTQSAEF